LSQDLLAKIWNLLSK